MKFELKKFHRNVSEEDLLADLKAVHQKLSENSQTITSRQYDKNGNYTSGTISKRFGSWNQALKKAQLAPIEEKNVAQNDLFQNLEKVWLTLGRQPVTRDLTKPLSKYTSHIYTNKILMRDGFACKSCGRSPSKELGTELHVDHIIPWSKGGESVETFRITPRLLPLLHQ